MLVMTSLSKRPFYSGEEMVIASVVPIEVLCRAMKSSRQTWQLSVPLALAVPVARRE
jgi:hypothetical protein